MNNPTITCPHCSAELRLPESLAAQLIRTAREQYEKRIAQKEADVARRESAIAAQRAELARAVEAIDSKSLPDSRLSERLPQRRRRGRNFQSFKVR